MMSVNIQYDIDKQKANFDHFNELKKLYFEHHSQDFKYLLGQKQGCVNSRGCLNSNKYGISKFGHLSSLCRPDKEQIT